MTTAATPEELALVRFDAAGLVPAVVQDAHSLDVLMVAYMNAESLALTFDKGLATFWSRSREELWTKGETSGNALAVVDVRYDCDADCLLVLVEPRGDAVACHTGERSCFYRRFGGGPDQAPSRPPHVDAT